VAIPPNLKRLGILAMIYMKFKIELIRVGRDDKSLKFEFEGNLLQAQERAIKECKKYLMSSDVDITPISQNPNYYWVNAGFRTVGNVTIKEIKEKKNANPNNKNP
jgi:hypothetical protein